MKIAGLGFFRRRRRVSGQLQVRDEIQHIPQPVPFDADWIRYCPQRPFPPYRHVPGVTPHPINDVNGHSYGVHEETDDPIPPPEAWSENDDYLYGVDLYNFAYWWEAHEAWEGLWQKAEDEYRLFLQGLIQISASLIKYHTRQLRPLRSLSIAGRDKVRRVQKDLDNPDTYMGINVIEFLSCLDTFFAPFFADTVSHLTYSRSTVKPLIRLDF